MTKRPIVTIAAVALLAMTSSVGCKREVAPQAVIDPAAAPAFNQAPAYNPAYNNAPGQSEPGPDTYPAFATRRYVRTITPPPAEAPPLEPAYSEPHASVQRYREPYRESRPRRRVVTRERPFSHSAAIVGGSAGAGAAVGALAGGGKGAGIGALAGGGAGFIYDRLTHKRKETIEDQR